MKRKQLEMPVQEERCRKFSLTNACDHNSYANTLLENPEAKFLVSDWGIRSTVA